MKLIFAPDSFKGTLTACEICGMLTEAARKILPEAETVSVPLADGGEGTLDTMRMALGGETVCVTVHGPLGVPVEAEYLRRDDIAVIEMARAAGYGLLRPDERDPMNASTFGVGELVRHALEHGAKHIWIGLGGSATNDGGMGFLTALGAVFRDACGNRLNGSAAELSRVASADFSELPKGIRFTAIADVTNPLTGPEGATYIYGGQKGVAREEKPALDAAMAHYADVAEAALGRDIRKIPGSGAAGGLGAAVAGVLAGEIRRGIDAVFEATAFDEKLRGASVVITGEGSCDGQSVRYGKAPIGVYRKARAAGIPVVLITGSVGEGGEVLDEMEGLAVLTTVNAVMPLEKALKNAAPLMKSACIRVMKLIQTGYMIKTEETK